MKEQIQERPAAVVMPIDKLWQTLPKFDADEYCEVVRDSELCTIREGKTKKNKSVVKTEYRLRHEDDFDDMTPISWFDLGVNAVCSAYYKQDNIFTVDMILRALIGKKKHYTDDQRQAVLDSVMRQMKTLITVDMTRTCAVMKRYKTDKPRRTAAILPCEIVHGVIINGLKTSAIKMYAESPLMEIAEMKNQLLTIGSALLEVPKLNNTPRVVTVKLYVITYALIYARNLRNNRKSPTSITFEKIYEVAGVSEENRFVKRNVREVVIKVAEWLLAQNEISGFKIVTKGNQSHETHAISFFYDFPAQE